MPRVGFEPTISADERPKTYALDPRPLGPAYSASELQKFIYVSTFRYGVWGSVVVKALRY